MGADLDLAQRAIVFQIAMVNTLVDGAFDCLVGVVVHVISLPYLRLGFSMSRLQTVTQGNSSINDSKKSPEGVSTFRGILK